MTDLEKGSGHKYIVTSESPPDDVSKSCAQSGSRAKAIAQVALTVSLLVFIVGYSSYVHTDPKQETSPVPAKILYPNYTPPTVNVNTANIRDTTTGPPGLTFTDTANVTVHLQTSETTQGTDTTAVSDSPSSYTSDSKSSTPPSNTYTEESSTSERYTEERITTETLLTDGSNGNTATITIDDRTSKTKHGGHTTEGTMSTQVTDEIMSTQVINGIMNTQFPDGIGSTHVTDRTLTTQVTVGTMSTQVTDKIISTQLTDGIESTQVTDKTMTTQVTGGTMSTQVTDEIISTHLTDGIESTQVTDRTLSTQVTDGTMSTQVTDEIMSTEVTDGIMSTQITDGIMSTQMTNNEITSQITDGTMISQVTKRIMGTPITDKIMSTQVTDRTMSTPLTDEIMSTQSTDKIDSTQVTFGGTSNQVTDGIMSTQVTNEIMSTQITDGIMSTQMTSNEITTQVTDGTMISQVTDGIMRTKVTDEIMSTPASDRTMSTQVTDGIMSTQVTDGIMTTQVTNQKMSTQVIDGIMSTQVTSNKTTTQVTDGIMSTQMTDEIMSTQVSSGETTTQVTDGTMRSQLTSKVKETPATDEIMTTKRISKEMTAITTKDTFTTEKPVNERVTTPIDTYVTGNTQTMNGNTTRQQNETTAVQTVSDFFSQVTTEQANIITSTTTKDVRMTTSESQPELSTKSSTLYSISDISRQDVINISTSFPDVISSSVVGQENNKSTTTISPNDTAESTAADTSSIVTELEVTTVQMDDVLNSWPYTYGSNIDLNTQHRLGLRKGQATDSHSCDDIRSVPDEYRSKKAFYTEGIAVFYQKYTEAYGIPVVASINVTDEGLRRACYTLRLLLASRYDIRNTMYKFYIRLALIGDDEQTTSLWEYRDWNSEYWDSRTRGVGPSLIIPLASAGDDNQRCQKKDRYVKYDILLHELSHGVHHFGARYVIPGFDFRLKALYDSAMSAQRYKNSYAATNMDEYWAVATEFYFGSYTGNGYKYHINGTLVALRDKETLALYDPGLVDLLQEVYSCPNVYYNRCAHKECNITNFQLLTNDIVGNLSFDCDLDQMYGDIPDPSLCAQKACTGDASVFLYKPNNTCLTYHCTNTTSLGSGDIEGDLYIAIDRPGIGEIESSMDLQQLCTKPVNSPGRCTNMTADESEQCGPLTQTVEQCEARGCCYIDGQCMYSHISECVDQLITCYMLAEDGLCDTDVEKMTSQCPVSCNTGICDIQGA